ncbi:MAG: GNAT family N-acetyltransferase [Myxococcaceae bacterium]
MNLFSTDLFLRTLAEVRYPGRRHELGLYRVGGRVFRLLAVDGEPVTEAPFLDFFQPLEGGTAGPVRDLAYLPRAVLETTPAEERTRAPLHSPSPYVDWTQFADWPAFEGSVSARIGNLLPDSARRTRKLVRDLGPLRFLLQDPRPEVFERCLSWKSAQYRASGLPDLFADGANVRLFRELARKGAVLVTSLSAGDTLLAVHLAGFADNRLYWWVPAYDPGQAKYSPGRLLLLESLRESQRRGHAEFDFLIGDEGYKWHFATHNRAIGELGNPPLSQWLKRQAARRLTSALEPYPAALEAARAVKRRLGL